MANLNCVLLLGRLTRDPELKYTISGTAVCNFGLAINRVWTDANGEKKEEACFVDVVAWNKTAENVANYLNKGSEIFVEGRLQLRSWQTQDGQKRSKLEVVAGNVQFMGKKEQTENGEPGDDIPFE